MARATHPPPSITSLAFTAAARRLAHQRHCRPRTGTSAPRPPHRPCPQPARVSCVKSYLLPASILGMSGYPGQGHVTDALTRPFADSVADLGTGDPATTCGCACERPAPDKPSPLRRVSTRERGQG